MRFCKVSFPLCAAFLLLLNAMAAAQTLTTLHSFNNQDGAYPIAPLILDSEGNLYGSAGAGGLTVNYPFGSGVLFEITPSGSEIVIHYFGSSPTDGIAPNAVIRDASGNFYGTTEVGGTGVGAGTIFGISAAGTETVLYNFQQGPSGSEPESGLVQDRQGNLYGTTVQGGYSMGECTVGGCGLVFKVAPSGAVSVLYNFTGPPDADYPDWPLAIDAQGNLYGTSAFGGAFGYGAVYKITPTGTETVIYNFPGPPGAAYPIGGLLLGANGALYGATASGGPYTGLSCTVQGCGTVYELTPSRMTILYSFEGGSDGAGPSGGLVRDGDGNFYGATGLGGVSDSQGGQGVIYELTPAGVESVLYRFTGGKDGAYPLSPLTLDQSGNIYGVTFWGGVRSGDTGFGTAFKLIP